MKGDQDFLEEVLALSEEEFPGFRALVDAAAERRRLMRELAALRKKKEISQKIVAKRMGTSQPVVARLETQSDAKESTLDSYAAAIGARVVRKIVTAVPARMARVRRN
jgi:hypothetical protein